MLEDKYKASGAGWKHIQDLVFNKYAQTYILQKYDNKKELDEFGILKQPNYPFYCIDNSQFDFLKNLSEKYKESMTKIKLREIQNKTIDPKSPMFGRSYEGNVMEP